MAVVECSTWAQLKTALQASNDVKLMADIDMNEVAPNGDYITLSYGESLTLDGNHHKIRNLRTTVDSPRPIFACQFGGVNRRLIIKDLDFQNLILAGASLVGSNTGYSYPPSTTQINSCRFVGSRSGAAYLLAYNTGITANNCYFDLPWTGAGQSNLAYTSLISKNTSSATTAVANYCRFKEKYTGWIYPSEVEYNTSDKYFSFSFFKINGCRIEGSFTLPNADIQNASLLHLLSTYNLNAYTPSAQNVFDVELSLLSNDREKMFVVTKATLIKKSAKLPNGTVLTADSAYETWAGDTPILATAEEMTDAAVLSAKGFDIVVPE